MANFYTQNTVIVWPKQPENLIAVMLDRELKGKDKRNNYRTRVEI